MATTQSVYRETHEAGSPGLCATTRFNERTSLVVESGEIPFGYAVSYGSDGAGNRVSDGTKAIAGNGDIAGVAIMDKTLIASQEDKFVTGDVVGALWRGDIWVPAAGSVSRGDAVGVAADGQLGPSGSVGAATITNSGSGYTSAPGVAFANAPAGGTRATGVAVVENGIVTAIRITNPGSGYTSAPAVTFSGGGGGSGAAVTAALAVTLAGAAYVRGNSAAGGLAIVRLGN
ncbi:MAG: hypothetical protein OXC29_20300 [Rhodococcus sp.]|nr:hypothetical protein [Rhodococcus sp. (in: high G+C Gram-positive bacteria)]